MKPPSPLNDSWGKELPTTLKTGMARKYSGIPTVELLQNAQKLCRATEWYYFGKHHDVNSQIRACVDDDSHTACLMPLNSKLYLSCHKNVGPVHAAIAPCVQVVFLFSKLRMPPLAQMATVPPPPCLLGNAPCPQLGELCDTNVLALGFRGFNHCSQVSLYAQRNCKYGL